MNNKEKKGKLILFFEKGELQVGVLKDAGENYGRPLIITDNLKEKFINKNQIYRVYETHFGEKEFQQFVERLRKSYEEIDLETLWEITFSCPDIRELKEEEMLTTLYGNPKKEDEIALTLKLNSEGNIFFKKKEGTEGIWIVRDEKEISHLKKEREAKEKESRIAGEIQIWFQKEKEAINSALSKPIEVFFSKNYPKYTGEISEELKEAFETIRNFFVRKDDETKAKKFFGEILRLKNDIEIFKFLCFVGFINPYENFFTERFNLNARKISVEGIGVQIRERFEEEKEKGIRAKITTPAFSIDIEGTEIRDDAISIPQKKENEKFHIEIHIADTTLLDREDIIQEVIKRGKTLYFPEGKIDMLPESAVRELSLDANKTKPAITFSADVELCEDDGKGFDGKNRINISNINVRRAEIEIKGNYEFSSSSADIEPIKELGLKIYKIRRFKMGGLDLISEDLALFLVEGEYGPEIKAVRWKVSDLRIAVSEFMMLCAWILAEFAKENSIPIYYRRSKISDEKKTEMSKFNRESEEIMLFRPYIVWKNIRSARFLETVTIPAGAESIGYPLYAWGTSPLRRGWDFFNILQIGRFLKGEKMLKREELENIKEKLQVSISNAESAEERRYKYILSVYILKNLKGKVLNSILIEKGEKYSLFWVDEIASFVKGETPKNADELENVPVMLYANPITSTIKAIPV